MNKSKILEVVASKTIYIITAYVPSVTHFYEDLKTRR